MKIDNTGFQELEIYKKAVMLRQKIFDLSKSFPKEEKFRLCDQLIRSTRKCPANIAEGHGRFHYQENIQYCRIARGSLCETIDHLSVALECEYISKQTYKTYSDEIKVLLKMLNGYINYLRRQKSN